MYIYIVIYLGITAKITYYVVLFPVPLTLPHSPLCFYFFHILLCFLLNLSPWGFLFGWLGLYFFNWGVGCVCFVLGKHSSALQALPASAFIILPCNLAS